MFVRLLPFIFNSRDALVLVFKDSIMTVIADGAPVLSGGSNYALVTPYLEEDLARLAYVQAGNVVTIVHPNYPPYELTRVANDNWTLAAVTFGATVRSPTQEVDVSIGYNAAATSVVLVAGGGALMPSTLPFYVTWWDRTLYPNPSDDPNVEAVKVTAISTDTLTVTRAQLGTSASDKNTGGSTYALAPQLALASGSQAIDGTLAGWRYVVTSIGADGEESLASSELAVPLIVTAFSQQLSWSAVAGADSYRIYRAPPPVTLGDAIGAYGFVGVSVTNQFLDYGHDPDFLQQPPIAKTVFASAGNYPSAVGYWQQRRVFANTTNNPDTVWASQSARHKNFNISVPVKDDDAITFRLVSDTVDEIRHVLAQAQLTLLTEGGEWPVLGDSNGVLTPFAVSPRRVSSHGVGLVRPVPASGSLLFPQALGSTVLGVDGASARDLTLFSTHLFDGHQIIDMAWQQETPHVAWFVREDGVLLGLTYIPDQDVIAWHRHDMDGLVESVCVVPEVVGLRIEHRVYVVVGRQVDATVRHSVERFASPFSDALAEEAWFVDGGVEYDGRATLLPTDSVSGLDHLEGMDVAVYAYGKVVGAADPDDIGYVVANPLRSDLTVVTVSGGAITLPDSYLRILVGLPFISDLETLDIDAADGATTKTQKTNITRVGAQVLESRNVWVGGELPDDASPTDQMDALALSTDADYDDLTTGFVSIDTRGQWQTNGRCALRSIDPVPLCVLSMVPQGYFPDPRQG